MNGVLPFLSRLSDSTVCGWKLCWKRISTLIPGFLDDGKTYGNVDDQDGDVTQRGASSTQICESLVTRCINDEQTRNLDLVSFLNDQLRSPTTPTRLD